jgi:hypothetical protein
MLSRLFMAVLIFWLAVPAVTMPGMARETAAAPASCHDTPPTETDGSRNDRLAIAHAGCLGCLAPFAGVPNFARPLMQRTPFHQRLSAPLGKHARTPEPPPPRSS